MNLKDLDDQTDEEIHRFLADRWIYRGGVLALLVVFGVLLTMLAARGVHTLPDQVVAAALILCSLLAAGAFVVLRQQDRGIYRRLREKRRRERKD